MRQDTWVVKELDRFWETHWKVEVVPYGGYPTVFVTEVRVVPKGSFRPEYKFPESFLSIRKLRSIKEIPRQEIRKLEKHLLDQAQVKSA